MKVSKQEAAILGTFLAVVVVAAGGYIWYTTRPPSGAQLTQTANADLALQEEEIRALDTVSALLDGQRIDAIVRSGVFDGLPVEGSVDVLPTSYTPIPVETKRVVEVQDGESAGAESEGPGALIGPNGPTVITRKLTAIDVAITGIVLGRNTARALVFNNAEEEGKWIDVPGEAYGYQVEYVTMKGAVVSKDGRTYVLLLGANRKDTQDYSVPGAGGGGAPQTPPPGQTPGPDGPPQTGPEARGFGGPPPGAWGGPPPGFRGGPPGGFGGGRGMRGGRGG